MSNVIITPSKLSGTINIPSSKSCAHRMILCAALARSKSTLSNIYLSQDIEATINCIKALGANVFIDKDSITVDSTELGKNIKDNIMLDCCESGSTIRFIIPICAALGIKATFIGKSRLVTRPLDIYSSILPEHGVKCDYQSKLPFSISGKLNSGKYYIAGNVSSQFITGLLLSLPIVDGDSEIILTTKLESSGYVDLTIDIMSQFGIQIQKTGTGFLIKGNQSYKKTDATVESDWSQAAFFLTAGALGSDVKIHNLNLASSQGDKAITDILKSFGADIFSGENYIQAKKNMLWGINSIDVSNVPDLVPIICVAAAFSNGVTHIINAHRLKLKESDRIFTTAQMINSLGGKADFTDDSLTIYGTGGLLGGTVNGYNDHRIVMASSIAALYTQNPTTITYAQSVKKSYPEFFEHYNALGGKANAELG